MAEAPEICGSCDARFAEVKRAFASNFEDGLEIGASFAATVDGRFVVDLWAGHADQARVYLRVPDVTGGTVEYQARGELVFRRDGREHSLIATAGDNARSFFIMMWDSTAVNDTYQGGRYLQASLPDDDGWSTIDFNRAYNAPCVFTAFSVCALPPRENWLELHVSAGEKRPAKPVY